MATDKYDKLGPMLSRIGEEAGAIVGGNPDGLYLYVEVGDGWIEPNVYRDEGNAVRYFDPTLELCHLIATARETENPEDPASRWSVMEYEVHGTKFDAHFKFPDQVNVEKYDKNRRENALKKHFGDKPVIYPPMPEMTPHGN